MTTTSTCNPLRDYGHLSSTQLCSHNNALNPCNTHNDCYNNDRYDSNPLLSFSATAFAFLGM